MKVTGKGRQVKTDHDPQEMTMEKKTKGALLQEMITTAHDQLNSGNADGFTPCGLVNSECAVCIYILASTITMTSLLTLDHTTLFFILCVPQVNAIGQVLNIGELL